MQNKYLASVLNVQLSLIAFNVISKILFQKIIGKMMLEHFIESILN